MAPCMQTAPDLFSDEWHDHDVGKELPCTNLRTLSSYLFSEGAAKVTVSSVSLTSIPSCVVRVIGPRCDNEGCLSVSYKLNKGEFSQIPEEEKKAFIERLSVLMAPQAPSWRVLAVLGLSQAGNS